MTYILKTCLTCKIPFEASLKEHQRGNAKYCSKQCFSSRKIETKLISNLNCGHCNKPIYRSERQQKRSKTKMFFCSRICKDKQQINLLEPSTKYRNIAFKHYESKCYECGWNTQPEILEVHHIDRNRTNNDVSNLKVVCPTCHSLIHFRTKTGVWTRMVE